MEEVGLLSMQLAQVKELAQEQLTVAAEQAVGMGAAGRVHQAVDVLVGLESQRASGLGRDLSCNSLHSGGLASAVSLSQVQLLSGVPVVMPEAGAPHVALLAAVCRCGVGHIPYSNCSF